MKKMKFLLIAIVLFLAPTMIYAGTDESPIFDITQIIVVLTPGIVWLSTWITKNLLPKIPNWTILILLVPLFSTGLSLVTEQLGNPDILWWEQLIYGLLAVFIDQLKKQVK